MKSEIKHCLPANRPAHGWPRPIAITAFIGLMALSGCGRDEIRVYQVPKEKAAQPRTENPATTAGPSITWRLPQGWTELPPGQMRVGFFGVKDSQGREAQVTIIPLPDLSAKDLENVNRWRGQVGLGPIAQEQLTREMQKAEIAGQDGQLYDMAGVAPEQKDKTRLLAAILHRAGTTWFFKMTGPDDWVAAQKPVFADFLKSVSFAGEATPPAAPRAAAADAATAVAAPPAKPAWTVPAGWQELPPGPMQIAKFAITGQGNAKAEVTVASFPGDVGGTLANVNRWRRQIGLPPVEQAGMEKLISSLEVGGIKAILADLTGEQNKTRLVAAILPRDGQTWFYKIVGDGPAVDQAKPAFIQFVQSTR